MSKTRPHFGYMVVAAMVITSFIPLSMGLSCAGIFYPALSKELGVETGMLSYFISILWAAALVTLPVTGRMLQNRDARVFLFIAVLIIVLDFIWLSFTHALWQFYVGGFAMGIAVGMLVFLAPSTLINRWFHKRAGFFIGVVMAFTGVGGVVWSSVGGVLINEIGWSATYLVFAVLSACTLPVTVFMVASYPHEKGLHPHGYTLSINDEVPNSSAPIAMGISASDAFKMPVFYVICAFCLLINLGMYLYFMIPSYASTIELGTILPLLGATASSATMAGQTISKLSLGALGEKHPYISTIVALALGLVGTIAFALITNSVFVFYAAALMFGFYYGITNVMLPIFTRMSFGDIEYPKIYARISMVASVSNAAAAFLWGTLIDATHSFMPMFIGVMVLLVGAILLVLLIARLQKKAA